MLPQTRFALACYGNRPREARLHQRAELLAVDDSAAALEAIRATVEPLGATLTTATSGEEALRCLLMVIAAIIGAIRAPPSATGQVQFSDTPR